MSQHPLPSALSGLVHLHQALWSGHVGKPSVLAPAAALHHVAGARAAAKRLRRTLRDSTEMHPAHPKTFATKQTAKLFAHAGMGLGALLSRPFDVVLGTGKAASAQKSSATSSPQLWNPLNRALDVGLVGAFGAGVALALTALAGACVGSAETPQGRLVRAARGAAALGATVGLAVALVPMAALRLGVEALRLGNGLVKLAVGGSFAAAAGTLGCFAGLVVGGLVYQAQRHAAAQPRMIFSTKDLRDNPWSLAPAESAAASDASDVAHVPVLLHEDDARFTEQQWRAVQQAIKRGLSSGTQASLPHYRDVPASPPLLGEKFSLAPHEDVYALWQQTQKQWA